LTLGLDRIDGVRSGLLVGDLVGLAQIGSPTCRAFRLRARNDPEPAEVARLFRSGFGELDDRVDDRLEALVAEHDGAEHDIFGQFLGFGFHHQNGVGGAGDDQVERGFGHLVDMRVEHIFAVDVADARAADRAHEGDAGQRQGSRSATMARMSGSFSRSCCSTVMMTWVSFL
jgi:hypothetical protein